MAAGTCLQFDKILESYRRASKYWSGTLNRFAEGGALPKWYWRCPARVVPGLQALTRQLTADRSAHAGAQAGHGGMMRFPVADVEQLHPALIFAHQRLCVQPRQLLVSPAIRSGRAARQAGALGLIG